MGRPRKIKAPKADKAVERTPFTVEVHGETIDLDLKLMLDPPDKSASKSLDQVLADTLKMLVQRLNGTKPDLHAFDENGDDDDPDQTLAGVVTRWSKLASDVELLTAYRLLVDEMKSRGMAKPKAQTEDIKPDDEQPTSA